MNNKYIIQEGPAKGLIHKVDVDNAIIDEATERIRPSIKNANDVAGIIELQRDVVADVIKSLEHKVYAGTNKTVTSTENTVDEFGNKRTITSSVVKPNTTSPRQCGITYTEKVLRFVKAEIMKNFSPYTPTLEHINDRKTFALRCSQVFPNVCDPWEAVEATRQFFENIHNSCKTPGAEFKQKCLWLYSSRTGHTGKSYWKDRLVGAFEDLGIDYIEGGFDKDWFDPTNALHTVLIVNDLDTLPSTHILNGLVDRSTFHYNQKGHETGNVTSCTNLVVTSNIEPWKQNRRRYNVIHFPGISIENLPAEERRFIPFWGDDEGYEEALKDMIRTCPFGEPYINPDETNLRERSDQYAEILSIVQKRVRVLVDNGNPTKMMPRAFIRSLPGLTMKEETSLLQQLSDFLAQAQNERKLVETGTTQAWKREIEFSQFLKWECGVQTTDESNWLENTYHRWQDLIKQQEGK